MNSLLNDFFRVAGECTSSECVYRTLSTTLSQFLKFDHLTIRIADLETGTVTDTFVAGKSAGNWYPDGPRPLKGTVTEIVMNARKALNFGDTTDPGVVSKYPVFGLYEQIMPSLLALPLIHRGRPVGSIQMRSVRKNAFSRWHAEALQTAAGYITPTIMNSIHVHDLEREVRERTTLSEIGMAASSTIDFKVVWDKIATSVQSILPCDRLVIALVNDDRESITDRYVYGVRIPDWDKQPRRMLNDVPAGKIVDTRRAAIVRSEEINEAHKKVSGVTPGLEIGLHSAMYVPLTAGDRIIGTMSIRSVKPNAYTEHELSLFERIALQISGSIAAAELYADTIRLSEERNARVELQLANRKMAEINAAKSRFISTISHELRTPLTSILAFTGIIRGNKGQSLTERDVKHLEVIHRNGQRLKEMIDDLLDLSSMESDKLSVLGTVFSLQELINSLVTSMRPIVNAKRQNLVIEFEDDTDIQLESDRERIDQILSNLVANASKYSPNDTEIRVEVRADDEMTHVAVIDHGIGIDPVDIPSLFDEFGRLSNSENLADQKPGLGLAISRKLARTLGGDISASSIRGEGSVFTLVLPSRMSKAA